MGTTQEHREKFNDFLQKLATDADYSERFKAASLSEAIAMLIEDGFTLEDIQAIAADNELVSKSDDTSAIRFWF